MISKLFNIESMSYQRSKLSWIISLIGLVIIFSFYSCKALFGTSSQTQVSFVVEVDSYGEDSLLLNKNAVLWAADSTINTSDLRHQEFYNYISCILTQKGYNIISIDSMWLADIIIFFDYGINGPHTKYYDERVSVPIQTGTKGTYSQGAWGTIQYNEYATYDYTYKTVQRSRLYYQRFLNFIAFDLEQYMLHDKKIMLWETNITSSGSSNDLRYVFPYMIVAAQNYIGHNSGQNQSIRISKDNSNVAKLKALK